MAVKSTQVFAVRVARGAEVVMGTCRIIKNEHRKDDPNSEGVPQREVVIADAAGNELLRITKFFRHLLLECHGAFETTDTLLHLTPENMRLLAEHLLLVGKNPRHILEAAMAWIDRLFSLQSNGEPSDFVNS